MQLTMSDPTDALRTSVAHPHALVSSSTDAQLELPAHPTEWSVADTLSHLGSGAVIMKHRVQDAHAGTNTPDGFAPPVSDAAGDVISVIRAGARGDVTKNICGPELIDAIYRIAAGDAVFSPRLAGFVLDAFTTGGGGDAEPMPVDPDLDQLTTRERQVLGLIARGYSYKDITKELTISAKTVQSHVSSVLRKLQLSSRYQLSHWATERHLF